MLKFSQNEIEGQLDDCFPYGSVKEVAIIASRNPSQLAQELNPNDERPSDSYLFLQVQCGLDGKYPEYGEAHWQKIVQFREASLPTKDKLDLDTEALKSHKESFDVANAVMAGQPLYMQLKE